MHVPAGHALIGTSAVKYVHSISPYQGIVPMGTYTISLILDMALVNFRPINVKTDRDALLESIEDQLDQISDAMHKAAKHGNCSRSPFKPKAYWCPELSTCKLRNKKRFWWFLWQQNDRPRQGILYECYSKGVTKLFRQTSRKAVDNTLHNNHAKLNSF